MWVVTPLIVTTATTCPFYGRGESNKCNQNRPTRPLDELGAESVDVRRLHARGFEVAGHPSPLPVDVAEHPEDSLRRAAQLGAVCVLRLGRSLADPDLVLLRELHVRLSVVGSDVLGRHLRKRQEHGRDKAGAVLAREAVEQDSTLGFGDRLEHVAERMRPFVDDEQVALEHALRVAYVGHVPVVDQRAVDVPQPRARGEGAWAVDGFRLAAQVYHRGHPVGAHRIAPQRVQMTEIVGPDRDPRPRHSARPGKAAEVAGVLAVWPVKAAHNPIPRLRVLPRKRGRLPYLFVNWGAFRALFSPYFLRSFMRASRVRSPAFFSGGRKSGS